MSPEKGVVLRLKGPHAMYEVVEGMSQELGDWLSFEDAVRKFEWLVRADPHGASSFGSAIRHYASRCGVDSMHIDSPVHLAAKLLSSGRLYIREVEYLKYQLQSEPPYIELDLPTPSDGRGARAATTSLSFRLENQTGESVPDESYKVRLPDGEVKHGNLDSNGSAKLNGVPRGVARIFFPHRDKGDWWQRDEAETEVQPSAQVLIQDEDGRMASGVVYFIAPDGTRTEVQLRRGVATLENVTDVGSYQVEVGKLRFD